MTIYDVIKKPLVSEKTTQQRDEGSVYAFCVELAADKDLIKKAVESLFSVKVDSVRTLVMPGRYKRVGRNRVKTKKWKKALVKLSSGKIELFEGV